MTEKEKRTILAMRAAGRQYKEISAELGIEVSALKVFVNRQKHKDVRRCEQCKKVLPKDARKTQRFCSDKCRNDWWYSHQGEIQGERLTTFICMPRIKMKQVQGVGRVTLEYAIDQFMRHNRLKNLSPRTLEYYEEDLRYFQRTTAVTYLDEITDKLCISICSAQS